MTGERREKTEWHRVVVFNRLADVARQYLKKGSNVFVQGELVYKKWKDKQDVEHTTAEIQAHLLQMLGSNTGNNSALQSQPQQNPAPQNNAQQTQNVENFDDMPF